VLQLQEACREARAEAQELALLNSQIRVQFRERENYWRSLWQAKKSGQSCDDIQPVPPPSAAAPLPTSGANVHVRPTQLQYPEDVRYRNDDGCSTTFTGSEHSYSPSIPLNDPDTTTLSPDDPSRLHKLQQFNYATHTSARDPRWSMHPQHIPGAPGGTIPTAEGPHQPAQSPAYLGSPSITAPDMGYAGRPFGAPEEPKVALHSVLDAAPYSFSGEEHFAGQRMVADHSVPGSRSLSPSSNTASTTSMLMPQFTFPYSDGSNPANDRRDFDFRRQSVAHGGDLTLHGGTTDASSLSGSDPMRFRIGSSRKSDGSIEQPPQQQHVVPSHQSQQQRTPPIAAIPISNQSALGAGLAEMGSSSSHHDRGSDESDAVSLTSRLRRRRGTLTSSRSPSPSPPSLSCTVAVIKAQAFGALRRTRARGKKSSEGAAKVAMDVLEARGIGIGVPPSSKRPRLDSEALTMET